MGFRAFGSAWTAGSVLAIVMAAPVQAAELSVWSYDEATQLLEFSLPQSVLPRFFLLAEPTRIVLDIPATQLGAVPTEQTYGGVVERIRVSQFEGDTVRMVIDLAPGTVLQERQADIEFDDDLGGQRRWRFRPRIDVAATTGAIATAPAHPALPVVATPPPAVETTAPLPEPPAASTETRSTQTPLADIPVSLENAEEISYSAAGLQLPERPTGAEALPVDLYAESTRPTTTGTVTVPPLEAAADTVAARPAPATAPDVGYVPPMVAPELETVDVPSTAAETAPVAVAETAPLPAVDPAIPTEVATAASVPATAAAEPTSTETVQAEGGDAMLAESAVAEEMVAVAIPVTPPLATEAVESENVESETVEPENNALETTLPEENNPPAAETVPPFIEPDASVAAEATQYTAAIVPLEPLPEAVPAPVTAPEASSGSAPIPVVDMGGTARTITQTTAPTVVQFGQPLPAR